MSIRLCETKLVLVYRTATPVTTSSHTPRQHNNCVHLTPNSIASIDLSTVYRLFVEPLRACVSLGTAQVTQSVMLIMKPATL